MQPITRVPKAPFYVEGVINLRGKVIPVIDMRKRFGQEKIESDKNNRIVVVNVNDAIQGIMVDAVTEVIRIPHDAIEPVSDIITAAKSDYLMGIAKLEDKMVILLDLGKLLSADSMASLAASKSAEKVPAGVK
jgi:purine-binding chemotaxis protein CheW